MKKVILFTIISFTTSIAFGQKKNKDLRIGFLLEPTLSWFNPQENGVKGDGSKFGLNYGLMFEHEFAENYILATGIQVSHLGGKLSYTGNSWLDRKVGYVVADNSNINNTANYNFSIQYLQLPFAIKLKSSGRDLNYWGSFGGFISVPLKARVDVETNFTTQAFVGTKKENDNAISLIQPINIGMQIGAGVELPLGNQNTLNLGLVFYNGFVDATKNNAFGNDGRVNMNNLTLKMGVFF